MRDPNFTEEAFNAFSSADAYIRAARDGLAGATHQLSNDMRVRAFRRFNTHVLDLKQFGQTDLRIVVLLGTRREKQHAIQGA